MEGAQYCVLDTGNTTQRGFLKQQQTFACKRDVGRQGITVFSQPPPRSPVEGSCDVFNICITF